MTDTIELIEKVPADLKKVGGIEACAAVIRDGLLIRAIVQNGKFTESFAVMSATMLDAAETATTELNKGVPNIVIVESKHGRLIAVGAGRKALLVDSKTRPCLILLEIENAAKKLKELLS